MARIHSKTAALFVVALNCAISFGQQASLDGVVKDREDKSPIRGAEVRVGAKVSGLTGVDGKYSVSNLRRGAKVEVTYTKQGYGAKTERIVLKDERTQRDIDLFKDTADAFYWSSWSDNLRKEVQAQGSGPRSQSERYARQWKEVEEAGLSDDAKTAAAKQLITVFPSQSAAPADLRAYAIDGFKKETTRIHDQDVNAQTGPSPANRVQIAPNQQDVASNQRQIDAYHHGMSSGEKLKINGIITARTGEVLVVRTATADDVIVALNDDTKVQQPKALSLRKKEMSATVLAPGLKISVEGVVDAQNRVVAKTINFNSDDLEMAEAIQAGLTPTKQSVAANPQNIAANKQATQANAEAIATNQAQTAANRQQSAGYQRIEANQQEIQQTARRFSELSEYDTKDEASVSFDVGSAKLSAEAKAALSQLARNAKNLTGYIIQVKGFADSSSGNASMNQKVSMDRAQAAISFLLQECHVPARYIVAPGAMGTADPGAPDETAQGRAENRRVEVKVLVNRGLGTQRPPA